MQGSPATGAIIVGVDDNGQAFQGQVAILRLTFCRFRKREVGTEAAPFQTHTELAKGLVDWVVARQIPGDFTCDSYCTNAELLHHIHGHGRASVGDLKANRTVTVAGQDGKVSDWIASQLGPFARTRFTVGGVTQWYCTKAVRLPKVSHPVRILVLWADEWAERPSKVLITNRAPIAVKSGCSWLQNLLL